MTATSVLVKPGPPTQLQGTVSDSLLIYNNDSANAIWIGSGTSVSPGNGTLVGPLGSVTWQTKGVPLWACVDTGVTQPVNVTVDPDTVNPDNPVAVGAAIAIELAETGIPIAITETFVGTFKLTAANSYLFQNIDVSKYSSLLLLVNPSSPDPNNAVLFYFSTPTGQTLAQQDYIDISCQTPVPAPFLNLQGTFAQEVWVDVYGSNRASESHTVNAGFSSEGFQGQTGVVGFTGNSSATLIPISNSIAAWLPGGPAFLTMVFTAKATLLGFLQAVTVGGAIYPIADTTEAHAGPGSSANNGYIYKMVSLPQNVSYLRFQGAISTGTVSANVQGFITPNY